MSLRFLIAGMVGAASARVALDAQRHRPRLSDHSIIIADLSAELDGYTIAVFADLHHQAGRDLAPLRDAVDMALAASPDLAVFLGDFGSSLRRSQAVSRRWYRRALTELEPELARVRPPDGTMAVLGNHDYYGGAEQVTQWFRGLGGEVLVNRSVHITRGQGRLRIAGMDDVAEGARDPRAGCRVDDDIPTILLSHNPDGILHLAPDIRVDLMLAGHTHGGQIVFPFYGAPLTMSRVCGPRTASGWIPNARAPLYVSRGLGAQLPLPIRVNCPPELLVIRLRRAKLDAAPADGNQQRA